MDSSGVPSTDGCLDRAMLLESLERSQKGSRQGCQQNHHLLDQSQNKRRHQLKKKRLLMTRRRKRKHQRKEKKEQKAKKRLTKRMQRKKLPLRMEKPKMMRHSLLKAVKRKKPSQSNCICPSSPSMASIPPYCIVNREEYFYQLFYKYKVFLA
ncbi:high mobility group nucleosomal binding domain 7 isoform X1 [Chiloscyllium plagiosum]|uniref:high mobility group nucleosomal binding domain 7 isoform X1 n=1 Tax=Chiloscyllium plagiosum TaxID=36176 RepID=UPI001CB7FC36|nr:high mobility group nucleosomal binding domain 7 isoform X1 [Chiloscyllium plagiosum]